MSKTKTMLIVALAFIILGALIFVCAMSSLKWDFSKLSNVEYTSKSYTVSEKFESISIITDTSDVHFVSSDSDAVTVDLFEQKGIEHSVTVIDGTLVIELSDTRKWYDHINIISEETSITLRIPNGQYSSLSVKADTADIYISDAFKFESVNIETDTGDVSSKASVSECLSISTATGDTDIDKAAVGSMYISTSSGDITVREVKCSGDIEINVSTADTLIVDVSCKNLISEGSTGDITLSRLVCDEKMKIERSTGDVELNRSDAYEIFIDTDTGDVEGTILSEKVFIIDTDTGERDVPNSTSGGRCEINTDTGDIKIDYSK